MTYALVFNLDDPPKPPGLDSNEYRTLLARLRDAGRLVGSRQLASPGEAATVRVREGHAPEQADASSTGGLAGFVLVECESEAAAVKLAQEASQATGAAVEVRAIAAAGEGGSRLTGIHAMAATAGTQEFAFLMNVAEADRPWPGNPAFDRMMERCGRVLEQLQAKDAFRGTARLVQASKAKTVKGGRVLDGPFAEARELIGGFILGECESREIALALARTIPGAGYGSVEVRAVVSE